MRKVFLAFCALVWLLPLSAQEDKGIRPPVDTSFFRLPAEVTDAYLDSINTASFDGMINDYVMFGFYGGGVINNTSFNPRWESEMFTNLPVFGASLTVHGKLFGFMPYFGLEIGAQHTYEGYKFKTNKETGITRTLEGATQAKLEVWEVPFLMVGHLDIGDSFKILAKAGIYGGYRTKIERIGESVNEEIRYAFLETDNRWDYGFEGGVGFGFMFSPFEFHVNGLLKWGWESYYKADYFSPYYYRFAYPFDIMITAGIYYQLTPRRGYTRKQLKNFARQIVYDQ